ncbi:MAG: ABC transporter ATP-binding protein [Chloroflexi bacterium]|nr:ABC transporter ATP-binding protein [Chloroflexota bacterium]
MLYQEGPSTLREVLRVEDLTSSFLAPQGVVKAVNGVSFSLRENQVLALVGESGSGKTATALSILGILPYPGKVLGGRVFLRGKDLFAMSDEKLRRVRGKEVGIIFQDPQASLNPTLTVGTQVEEVLQAHLAISRRDAQERATEMLAQMELPDPRRLLGMYPFQLSGGMCQRVMLAIALALRPNLLIADEPTSNLDVTLQAGILNHLKRLKQEYGTAILLITHDMGVVAQMADQVAVMYAGSIVEYADTRSLFRHPSHPYTWGLFQALPRLDNTDRRLRPMRGTPPDLMNLPKECPFIPRCLKATNVCRLSPSPTLRTIEPGHAVACFNEVRYHWDQEPVVRRS